MAAITRMCRFVLSLGTAILFAADAPPNPFIDRDRACPFEGCTYREWIATKPITLVDRPHGHRVVAHLKPGEHVTAIDGEIWSKPLRIIAGRDIPDPYHPDQTLIDKGETFYVLHYLGECHWLLWYRGKTTMAENCEGGPFPEATWWVRVKTTKGITGWTISNNNFDGQVVL